MTDDLDTIATDIAEAIDRYNINHEPAPLPDPRQHAQNLLNTQTVITTKNNWSLTEAAEILTRHYGRDTAARFSMPDRKRALEKLITQIVFIDRRDDDIAHVRKAWQETDQTTYDGDLNTNPDNVPTVFNDENSL